jgi:hypothetical protein
VNNVSHMGRILTNFQVRASEDDDAAKFEQTVVTKVFPSVSNQFRQDAGRCAAASTGPGRASTISMALFWRGGGS